MICPPSPYAQFPETELVKLQALVSRADKELLMTILPDRGLYTYVLAITIKRAADFIRINDLDYNDTDQRRLIDFLARTDNGFRQHAPARSVGKADARNVSGGSKGVRKASANPTDIPPGDGSSGT